MRPSIQPSPLHVLPPQVISACAVSFAHGANDVANAIGPFAAIYGVYQNGYVSGLDA